MSNQNLTDHLIENWRKPFKTVSFWVISIASVLLRDQIYNYDTSVGSFFHRTDLMDWLLGLIIVFAYIFSVRIDDKIRQLMSS